MALVGLAVFPLVVLPRRWRWWGMGIASVPLLIYLALLTPWGAAGLEAGLTTYGLLGRFAPQSEPDPSLPLTRSSPIWGSRILQGVIRICS